MAFKQQKLSFTKNLINYGIQSRLDYMGCMLWTFYMCTTIIYCTILFPLEYLGTLLSH